MNDACEELKVLQSRKCILLVEDEEDVLQTMVKSLLQQRRDNYDVLIAVDGYEAIEFMIDKQVDLVVLDLNMSNFNGLQVCQQMMRDKELQSIHIVISSGHLDLSMIEQLETLGVHHFLKKPYPMRELIEKIDSLLMPQA